MLIVPLLLSASQLSSVAIDLPADAAPATVQKVVQSCNQALGGPRCEPLTATSTTTLVAIVRWEGAELHISLRRGSIDGEQVDHREVAFAAEDAPQDRFITAGLMVAALTAAQTTATTEPEPPPESPPEPPPQAAPPPRPPPTPPAPKAPSSVVLADLGALIGPGLEGGGVRWGGGARLSWVLRAARVGATAQLDYSGTATPTQVRWGTGSAGLITRATAWGSFVGAEVLGEGVVQRAEARATRNGETQVAGLWRLGGRFTLNFSLETGALARPFAGFNLTLLERGFRVKIFNEQEGSEPPWRLMGQFGIRLGPF